MKRVVEEFEGHSRDGDVDVEMEMDVDIFWRVSKRNDKVKI